MGFAIREIAFRGGADGARAQECRAADVVTDVRPADDKVRIRAEVFERQVHAGGCQGSGPGFQSGFKVRRVQSIVYRGQGCLLEKAIPGSLQVSSETGTRHDPWLERAF